MEPSRLDPLKRWLSPRPAVEAPVEARDRAAKIAAAGREHLDAARGARDQRLDGVAKELYLGAIKSFAEARALLRSDSTSGATSDAPPPADGSLDDLDRAATRLLAATHPLSDAEVAALTLRRRVVAGVPAVALLALRVRAVRAPRNVARGKPVTASSVRLGAPQGLVNGAIEGGPFGLPTGAPGPQ